mmetsp:Transcript_113667/g.316550  ORF Transcript_113667/g.316550 Transcript_113667/m.316550 type:complete len:346 (-) Transcript_113667:140-1177(-)
MNVSGLHADPGRLHLSTRGTAPECALPHSLPCLTRCREQKGPTGVQEADELSILGWLQSTQTSSSQSATEEPTPLLWDGQKLPGERAMNVKTGAKSLLAGMRDFLAEALPAEMEEYSPDQHHLRATFFLDHVPQGLEARVLTVGGDRAVALLRSVSRQDPVRFHQMFKMAVAFLRSKDLEVEVPCAASNAHAFDDFSWASDLEEESNCHITWLERLRPLLTEVMGSARPAAREEAAQVLAEWAKGRPACHLPLAQAMAEQQCALVRTLLRAGPGARLAEAYPLAAALRLAAARCPEAAVTLASSQLRQLRRAAAEEGVPRLVARELAEAAAHIERAVEGAASGGA